MNDYLIRLIFIDIHNEEDQDLKIIFIRPLHMSIVLAVSQNQPFVQAQQSEIVEEMRLLSTN